MVFRPAKVFIEMRPNVSYGMVKMTGNSVSAFYATLLSLVILFSQNGLVLGQDEPNPEVEPGTQINPTSVTSISVTPNATDNDSACPCIATLDCPRVYGTNPLDFTEIGEFGACEQEGFVRCCGVSVSVVQQSATSEDESELAAEQEGNEEASCEEEQCEEDVATDEIVSNKEHDDLHEYHEHEETHEESSATDIKDPDQREDGVEENYHFHHEQEDDNIPSESSPQAQSVIIQPGGPARRRLLNMRRNQPTDTPKTDAPPEEASSDAQNSQNNPSSSTSGGNVMYSKRVTKYSAYAKSTGGTPAVEEIRENEKQSEEANDGVINQGNRPKFPARRVKPMDRFLRHRQQKQDEQQQAEKDVGTGDENPEMEQKSVAPGPLYGTTAEQSSAQLHVPETKETVESSRNELDGERRPMSRLVKPRVNGLIRGRKKVLGSVNAMGSNSQVDNVEERTSPSSSGLSPSLDNEKPPKDQNTQLRLSQSEGANGDDDNANFETKTTEAQSAAKVYSNSPTGKLMPLRPKIRPFTRMNLQASIPDGNTITKQSETNVASEETPIPISSVADLIKSTDSESGSDMSKSNNNDIIRKLGMKRIKAGVVPVAEVAQDATPMNSSPVPVVEPFKKRIRMRRPIKLASSNSSKENTELSPIATEQTSQLDPVQEGQEVAVPLPKITTLDIRSKLRGRPRNPYNAPKHTAKTPVEESIQSNSETETPSSLPELDISKVDSSTQSIDSTSIPDTPKVGHPAVSNIIGKRRRIRPLNSSPALGQGQTKSVETGTKNEEESYSSGNNEIPNGDINPSSSSSTEEPSTSDQPTSGYATAKKSRIPFKRLQMNSSSSVAPTLQDDSKEVNADTVPTESPPTRKRLRLPFPNRGNVKQPQVSSVKQPENGSGVDKDSSYGDDSPTSEAPVTVTSTYSRIRFNNNNGYFSRHRNNKPVKEEKESTLLPPTSTPHTNNGVPNLVVATAGASHEPGNNGGRRRFGTKSRFQIATTAAPTNIESTTEPEVNTKVEKEGQLNEPNESSQDPSHVEEKLVSLGQRKMRRVLKKIQHAARPKDVDQPLEEQLPAYPEKSQQLPYDIVDFHVSNPETVNSQHVAPNESVTSQPLQPDVSSAPASIEQPDEQSSVGATGSFDEVEILPVGQIFQSNEKTTVKKDDDDDDDDDEHEKDKDNEDNDDRVGDKKKPDDDDGDDEDDDDDDVNESDNSNDSHNYKKRGKQRPSLPATEEAYDLVLNKEKRKSLAVENAPEDALISYANPNKGETSNLAHRPTQSYATNQWNTYHQHGNQEGNGYSQEANDNPKYEKHAKYAGGIQQPTFVDFDDFKHKGISNYGENETPKEPSGSLDYGENSQSSYYGTWHNYDSEEEEESRIQEKYLRNKSSAKSTRVRVSGGSSESKAVSQNENSNSNEDNEHGLDLAVVSQEEQVGSSSPSPVNPFNRLSQSELPATSEPSNPSTDADMKRERNKRVRLKLRRPPSAYINNSMESALDNGSTTPSSVPFTPSLQSPRPTYSGNEALVESVNESVLSIPSGISASHNYPNSQQLEQFIQTKQGAPIVSSGERRKTRVRVKLVTLPTTTPAPAPAQDVNYAESGNDELSTPDAVPGTHFIFPPFQKSTLTLIPSTESPALMPDASSSQSYSSFAYTSSKLLKSTTVMPIVKTTQEDTEVDDMFDAPEYNSLKQPVAQEKKENKHLFSQGQASLTPITSSPVFAPKKHESAITKLKSNRFKVSDLYQRVRSTTTPPTELVITTVKPQVRIKSPQFVRKSPVYSTTEAPFAQQIPPTQAPINNYHKNESPEQNFITSAPAVTKIVINSSSFNEHDNWIENKQHEDLKLTSQYNNGELHEDIGDEEHTSDGTQDTGLRQSGFVNGPDSVSYEPPINHNINTKQIQSPDEATNNGKYNVRVIAPEKLKVEKATVPSTSPMPFRTNSYSTNEGDNVGGLVVNGGEFGSRVEMKKPFDEIQVAKPQSVHAVRIQNHELNHQEPSKYQSVSQEKPGLYTQINLPATDSKLTIPETVPDIRINVIPMEEVYHDDEHAPSPPTRHVKPTTFDKLPENEMSPFSYAVRNSPFGPFPSIDHWTGIPSANSPRLPEYFENKLTSHPVSSPPHQPLQRQPEYFEQRRPFQSTQEQQPLAVKFVEQVIHGAPQPLPVRQEMPEYFQHFQSFQDVHVPEVVDHRQATSSHSLPSLPVRQELPEYFERQPIRHMPQEPPREPEFIEQPRPTIAPVRILIESTDDYVTPPRAELRPIETSPHQSIQYQDTWLNEPVRNQPKNGVRFVDESRESDSSRQPQRPMPNVAPMVIQFGTEFDGEDDIITLAQPINSFTMPNQPPFQSQLEPKLVSGNRDVSEINMMPLHQQSHNLFHLPHSPHPLELGSPPQNIQSSPDSMELRQPYLNQNMPVQSNPLPSAQLQPVSFRQPPHELSMNNAVLPENPMALIDATIASYEIKDGELITPHHAIIPISELPKSVTHNHHHQQLSPSMHLANMHSVDQQTPVRLPINEIAVQINQPNGNFEMPELPPPSAEHDWKIQHGVSSQQQMNSPPPKDLSYQTPEFFTQQNQHFQDKPAPVTHYINFGTSEKLQTQNPNFYKAPESQFVFKNDAKPQDANLMSQHVQNHFQNPLEQRPMFVDKEAETKTRPIDGNFKNVDMDHGQQGVTGYYKAPLPLPKVPTHDGPTQGMREQAPVRHGLFGPPPVSQQHQPQYVPFNIMQSGQMQDGGKKQAHTPHQQPLIHHSSFQGPVKFGGQSFPPYLPPRHVGQSGHFYNPPVRNVSFGTGVPNRFHTFHQPHNSNFMNPRPNYRWPVVQSPMGIPNGQFSNNQALLSRHRNPSSRTSRAADLTEEEVKALVSEQLGLTSIEVKNGDKVENENQSNTQNNEQIANLTEPASDVQFNVETNLESAEIQAKENEHQEHVQVAPVVPSTSDAVIQASASDSSGSGNVEHSDNTNVADTPTDFDHSPRRNRQLNLEISYPSGKKKNGDELSVENGNLGQDKEDAFEEEGVQVENFVQDQLPGETSEPSIISIPHQAKSSDSDEVEDTERKADSDANFEKPSKWKNSPTFSSDTKLKKGKHEPSGRTISLKSSAPEESDTSEETLMISASSKTSYVMVKEGKESFYNGKLSKGKEGHKEQGQKDGDPEKIQEQQEFVAPKVVQRGFHPILPYSEQDPGPILVRMTPKSEKFLPPRVSLDLIKDGDNRPENGASLPIISPASNPTLGNLVLGSNPFNHLQDPMLFYNKHATNAQLPTNILNAAPSQSFKSLTHNHLTV